MVVLQLRRVQQVFLRNKHYLVTTSPKPPVITVPKYVEKYISIGKKRELEKRLLLKKRISYRGDTSFPVISCTDKQYNFYLGQIYRKDYPVPLLSKYWNKMKTSGQKFTIHPWDKNPSLPVLYNEKHKNDVFPKTFPELISDENVLRELANKGFKCPTPIQVLSMMSMLERKHLVIAGETGAGKTVGYLAPIIQNISSIKKTTKLFPNTPLAVVITPSRELAEQIGTVAYDLSRSSNLNVRVLVSNGTRHDHLRLAASDDVDILVASIGVLGKMILKGVFKLTNARHIVLDEADTLFDMSFIDDTQYILRRIPLYISSVQSLPPEQGTQLVLVSSTYPYDAEQTLVDLFEKEDVIRIKSPYLHKVLPHVKQRFWRVDHDNRSGVLLELVKSDYEKRIPVLIFCTHSETCDWMSHFLADNHIPSVKFHAGLSSFRRGKNLEDFQSGRYSVMIATDLLSRGIDTQDVKHVINFDFTGNVSDYILRAGRVGRVGSNQGHVTNLIYGKSGVYAVQEIEGAVRSSTCIPNVDSDIKKKILKMYWPYAN